MKGLYIVLAVALAVANAKGLGANKPLSVQVYYETLCPDTIDFITTQLYPTYVQLGRGRIDLELIPWGKARERVDKNGKKTFSCQHGPAECYGNKVHACVSSLTHTIEENLYFTYCSELSKTPANDTVLQVCAQGIALDWTSVEECLSSGKGDELLSANGKKTALVNAANIPTIVFNGNFYPERESVWYNFKTVVCQYIDCIY